LSDDVVAIEYAAGLGGEERVLAASAVEKLVGFTPRFGELLSADVAIDLSFLQSANTDLPPSFSAFGKVIGYKFGVRLAGS
jgi:hypothetical protein